MSSLLLSQLVIFMLDDRRYALPLAVVERIIRAVEITPLPKAPDIVLGLINWRGRIIPVMNLRRRFRLPERDLRLSDHFIVARTARRVVALVADAVTGIVVCRSDALTPAQEVLPRLRYLAGVVTLEDGLILIHDLDQFLSLEEEEALTAAMSELEPPL